MEALVDVYCEAPVKTRWKELADSAISPESRKEKWNDIEYWFVMGMLYYNSLAVFYLTRWMKAYIRKPTLDTKPGTRSRNDI